MKSRSVSLAAATPAAAALLLWTASLCSSKDTPAEFVWQDDLTTARKQASEEGRPLLVVFR